MSYLFLLIYSLIAACISYVLCQYINVKLPFSYLIIAIATGLTTSTILFFTMHHTNLQHENVLSVGTSADFPPFTYIEDNTIVGFDIDLIEEIGKRLDKKIEIKNMPFITLLPNLQLGTLQVVAAGLTATPERAHQVLFTEPYLEDNHLVIISLKENSAKTVEDLHNNLVIVNEGYTADIYLSQTTGPIIIRLKTPAEAFLALKSGRAFAYVTAENTVKPFFDQHGSHDFYVTPITHTQENTSLAIAPQYPELLTQIQHALNEMKKDGFIEMLKTKWGL
ncbi:MAG TPA: transporter substrate-binding domain-containing protein [Candidatus Dependentiae bacterium]|nr:transporter substrate-binding domain-containing protein [Candidatus Dependentiae bacterium]HRQ62901.1 transporter substrate-binding domain-containing protein [Candidatus Dependentiae bacterium]